MLPLVQNAVIFSVRPHPNLRLSKLADKMHVHPRNFINNSILNVLFKFQPLFYKFDFLNIWILDFI